jgi:ribonuclease Z
MGPQFLPRLVNGPFDDPALFVPFRHHKRALLFDLGDLSPLSNRDILKITHIFITHTHMDHFCGFDRVLRLLLGRHKELYLYGPQGFLDNLSSKLSGYCWNLVESYENRFILHATELHPDRALSCSYPCHKGFAAEGAIRKTHFEGVVVDEAGLTVRAVHLDHGMPVLAFRLDERFHVNIIKTALEELGLPSGPWLNRFKEMIYEGTDPDTMIEIPGPQPDAAASAMPLKVLKERIVRISTGQRLAYVADVAGSKANLDSIINLAQGVDHLFVEAAFSHQHSDMAWRKRHLTARQAGHLARECRVNQYTLFHHSPRYLENSDMLEKEAQDAFAGVQSVHRGTNR